MLAELEADFGRRRCANCVSLEAKLARVVEILSNPDALDIRSETMRKALAAQRVEIETRLQERAEPAEAKLTEMEREQLSSAPPYYRHWQEDTMTQSEVRALLWAEAKRIRGEK